MRIMTGGVLLLLVSALAVRPVCGQGTATSLTLEGLDQSVFMGARASAMGGAAAAEATDVTGMLLNPATLTALTTAEIRIGGVWARTANRQEQDWIPNRFYPNLSLLMEDMLGGIKEPDAVEAQDRLQKPFDALKPDWDRSVSRLRPSMIAAALPLDLGGVPVVLGAGFHQVLTVDHYYQNNNNLDPNLGLYRPQPIPVVTGQDSLHVRWFAYQRERAGAINGYTASASARVLSSLSVGVSATYYHGTSDDLEGTTERGNMTYFYDSFRLDPAGASTSVLGNSTYTGLATTIGLQYRGGSFSLAGVVRLPVTITREWERNVQSTSSAVATGITTGSEKILFPVSYRIGVALMPGSAVTLVGDLALRGTGDVEYERGTAPIVSPWLSSDHVHLGAEYRATGWLALRGGYRTVVQVFAPAGAGLIEEPARGSAYSLGTGLSFGALGVDVAYEYLSVTYQDKWQTNVNTNTLQRHQLVVETSLRF